MVESVRRTRKESKASYLKGVPLRKSRRGSHLKKSPFLLDVALRSHVRPAGVLLLRFIRPHTHFLKLESPKKGLVFFWECGDTCDLKNGSQQDQTAGTYVGEQRRHVGSSRGTGPSRIQNVRKSTQSSET